MASEAVAKRGRPKKPAIAEESPALEPPPKAKAAKKKGPAKTAGAAAAALEAAPKASGRTRKKLAVVDEPSDAIEILDGTGSANEVKTRSVRATVTGKRSTNTITDIGEAGKGKDGGLRLRVKGELPLPLTEKDGQQRADFEGTAEKVLERGEAIIREGETARQLGRLWRYSRRADETEAGIPGRETGRKADADVASITIVPAPASLEDTRDPVAVTSPVSTVSPATEAVDAVVPTPSSLTDPSQPPTLQPPTPTSAPAPHKAPLQQSKILTALAEELQQQAHPIPLAAAPDAVPPTPSPLKQKPAPTRMAPHPPSPNAPRKPHSAPPPPQHPARKAPPRIPFPAPPSAPAAPPPPAVKPSTLKSTARKYTMVMIALPIAIVTSWALYERLALGTGQKTLVQWPERTEGPAATATAEVEKPES